MKAKVRLTGYTEVEFAEHRDAFVRGTADVLRVSPDSIVIERVAAVPVSVSTRRLPKAMRVSVHSGQTALEVQFRVEVPVAEASQRAKDLKESVTSGSWTQALRSAGLTALTGDVALTADPTVQTAGSGDDRGGGPNVALIVSLVVVGVLLAMGGGWLLWRRHKGSLAEGRREVLTTSSSSSSPRAAHAESGLPQVKVNPLLTSVELSDRRV